MKTLKKSFHTPTTTPVDVQYRLKRADELLYQSWAFLQSVLPEALPDGKHAAAVEAVEAAIIVMQAAVNNAPIKKVQKSRKSKITFTDE